MALVFSSQPILHFHSAFRRDQCPLSYDISDAHYPWPRWYELPRSSWSALPHRRKDTHTLIQPKQIHARRTHRLLNSFAELEWEVHDAATRFSIGYKKHEILFSSRADSDISDDHWWDTLYQARNVVVPEDGLTEEFLDALIPEYWEGEETYRKWCVYKQNCWQRHGWGQYFRSNLDWDWDVAGSLRRVFRKKTSAFTPSLPASHASPFAPEVI